MDGDKGPCIILADNLRHVSHGFVVSLTALPFLRCSATRLRLDTHKSASLRLTYTICYTFSM